MSWSDETLASLYRESTRELPTSGPCPDPEQLERTLLGNADEAERRAVAEHLAGCIHCATFVQDLRGLPDWAERAARVVRRSTARRFSWREITWLPALAASLALMLGAGLLWTRLAPRPTPPDSEVLRGRPFSVEPAPNARLGQPPQHFDWPDEAGAVAYRLELFDARAEPVWTSAALSSSDCKLPDEVFAAIAAGAGYSWRVAVQGPVQRSRLGPFWFSVAARE